MDTDVDSYGKAQGTAVTLSGNPGAIEGGTKKRIFNFVKILKPKHIFWDSWHAAGAWLLSASLVTWAVTYLIVHLGTRV